MNQTDDRLSLFGGLVRRAGLQYHEVAAATGLSVPTIIDLARGNHAKRQARVLVAVANWLGSQFGLVDVQPQAVRDAAAIVPSTVRLEQIIDQFLSDHQPKTKAKANR